MFLGGRLYANVTCKRCGFRHPAAWSCAWAKRVAEMNRVQPAPEPEEQMQSLGMKLYELSCGILAARGFFFPTWDSLSQPDKDYWEELAGKFGEYLQ